MAFEGRQSPPHTFFLNDVKDLSSSRTVRLPLCPSARLRTHQLLQHFDPSLQSLQPILNAHETSAFPSA